MSGDEAMEVISLQAEASQIVPASHVLTRRGQTGHLSKYLKQAIVIEAQKTSMIFIELPLHGTLEQFHIGVSEGGEGSVDGNQTFLGGGPRGNGARRVRGSSSGSGGLQESTPANGELHGDLAWFLKQTFTDSQIYSLLLPLSTPILTQTEMITQPGDLSRHLQSPQSHSGASGTGPRRRCQRPAGRSGIRRLHPSPLDGSASMQWLLHRECAHIDFRSRANCRPA